MMLSQETDCRNQKAVLWPATGEGDDGEPTISTATGIEIDVRWEETQDQITDSRSNVIEITAKVVVNQVIAIGSILWLGSIDDVADSPVNLKQVAAYTNIPDIKSRDNRRTLLLRRHSNTLPDVA